MGVTNREYVKGVAVELGQRVEEEPAGVRERSEMFLARPGGRSAGRQVIPRAGPRDPGPHAVPRARPRSRPRRRPATAAGPCR
jgi:hypothetical protein